MFVYCSWYVISAGKLAFCRIAAVGFLFALYELRKVSLLMLRFYAQGIYVSNKHFIMLCFSLRQRKRHK